MVDAVRTERFYKKIKNKNKFVETPTLPLFKKVSGLHVPRLFYIAALWKRKSLSIPVIADLREVDQNEDGNIAWIDNIYSDDIIKINKLKKKKITMTKKKVIQKKIPHKFLNFQFNQFKQNHKKLLI